MESKFTILKLFNIEKSELKQVLWIILYSFLLGTTIAFFFTGSTSLFLSSFNNEMISLSFIIAGFIVIGVGQIYSRLQKAYRFSTIILIALGFLLVSLIVFIILFAGYHSIFIIFILYAWNRVIAYIHNVVFWGMAGKLFSLQQAKRVFGLISGGEVMGLMVAFFSTPFLLKIIDTEDLLIISLITLIFGFGILLIITRKFSVQLVSSAVRKKTTVSEKAKAKRPSFLQNRYYGLFFIIAFIPIFTQFFVDYIFQAQSKMEYPAKEDLTAFLGIFFGFGSVIEFILKSFISGKLMSRYGMKFGLLAFPLVMAFSFLFATLFGFIYGAISLFFSFIALGRLFTRAARSSFNDPATQMLYQPLPPDERISFQNKIESGPKAYASIIAGILLFVSAKIPGINLVHFSLFLLIVIIFWILSAKEIHKEYRHVLQSILSLKKSSGMMSEEHPLLQEISSGLQSTNQKDLQPIIRLSKIIMPFETEKILTDFEGQQDNASQKITLKYSEVIALSKSQNPLERILALKHVPKYSIYKVEKPLIRLLHDDDYEVKCEAIVTAARMRETELFYHLITLFNTPEYKTTVSQALVHIGVIILHELDTNFQKTEYDIDLQLKTIEILGKIGGEKIIDFLKRNINHHNKSVSDKVVQTLGMLKYSANSIEGLQIWQKLENEIKNYIFVTSALNNLKGQIAVNELLIALEADKKEKKQKIFDNLMVLYDPYAIGLIAENIESQDKTARGFAIEVADIVLSPLHKPAILPLLESEDDNELLQKYIFYYRTEKLDVVQQLTDIINSEYWVIGLYAKATAIKILANYTDNRIWPILMANIVHPKQIMWQLSAFCLYNRDKDIFEQGIYHNFPKIPGLKEFAANIKLFETGEYTLIYNRLVQIKSLELFADIPENELIELATSLKCKNEELFHSITFNHKIREYIILLSGNLTLGNKTYEKGDIFCPYLQDYNDNTEFFVAGENCTIIRAEFYLINSLLSKYKDFAQKLVDNLEKKRKVVVNNNEIKALDGMINANELNI